MISFEEAQKLITKNCPPSVTEEVFVAASLGCVNAEDILSPVALPLFDNSAMDGFVVSSVDTQAASAGKPVLISIEGVLQAGARKPPALGTREALRIMTGACMPSGGDAVITLEDAHVSGDVLEVREPVPAGQNIRYRGEEIKKGAKVLSQGTVINPGTIGFLSAMGIHRIHIFKAPRVSLVTTGSELIAPGEPLTSGRIYDANTAMIRAALEDIRIRPVFARRMGDHPAQIRKVVDFCLKESDIVILMGGVSAGEFDFVKTILADAGVETVFWKVSQKPGKPLYFGKKGNKLIFGLPGNPAAVFTCFYEYVYPVIRRFMGHENPYLSSEWIALGESLKPDREKTLFIKAHVELTRKTVNPLKKQKSHMLSSFCEANSFVVVPGSEKILEKGEKVEVHTLPYAAEALR